MDVALFDLDSTLLDCNSATLWVRQEWKDGRIRVRDVAWAAWVLAQYSVGVGELERQFLAAVAAYAGEEEAWLEARTKRWFDADVRHRLRPGARAALDEHRARGDRLVLATSSSVYAAAAALDAYGLDEAIASRFEVDAGKFTGRVLASAFGAHKADRVAEWAERTDVDLSRATFYTDSITDLALLERVGRPVAVNPDRKLRQVAQAKGWPVVDWGRSTAAPP